MVEAAEKLYKSKFAILQGSYDKGGVEGSAGTHDGGGAIDIDVRSKRAAQRVAVVKAMRTVGTGPGRSPGRLTRRSARSPRQRPSRRPVCRGTCTSSR